MTTYVGFEKRHQEIIGLGKSEVKPAPYGRNWLKILSMGAILFTCAGWGAGKVEELRRIEVAKIEAAKKAEKSKINAEKARAAALSKRQLDMQVQISQIATKLDQRRAAIVQRAAGSPILAEIINDFPAPVFALSDYLPLVEVDRASWLAKGESPNLDAAYQADREVLRKLEQWVGKVEKIARDAKWGTPVPAWFAQEYKRGVSSPVAEPSAVPAPAPESKPATLSHVLEPPTMPGIPQPQAAPAPAPLETSGAEPVPAPVVAQVEPDPQVPALLPLPVPAKPSPVQLKPKTAPASSGRTQVLTW